MRALLDLLKYLPLVPAIIEAVAKLIRAIKGKNEKK